jgi:hypothetical protein
MATGDSRLVLNAKTAEEMLQTPSVYRFRDSQIADVWRAFPHLRDSLPLVRSQLQERRLLFSEVWHLLKAYLNAKVPDWESLPPAQQEQLLLTTGTTFILEQLPPPLAWLAGAIARATVLRSLRARSLPDLVQVLGNPAPEHALEDIRQHNCLVQFLRGLELEPEFLSRLNLWDVRLDRRSGHWTIAAPLAARELAANAQFIHVRRSGNDEEGHTYWHTVDEAEADLVEGVRACIAHLRRDHQAWLGAALRATQRVPAWMRPKARQRTGTTPGPLSPPPAGPGSDAVSGGRWARKLDGPSSAGPPGLRAEVS